MQINAATTTENATTEFYETKAERNSSKLALLVIVQRYQPQKEPLQRHTDGKKKRSDWL